MPPGRMEQPASLTAAACSCRRRPPPLPLIATSLPQNGGAPRWADEVDEEQDAVPAAPAPAAAAAAVHGDDDDDGPPPGFEAGPTAGADGGAADADAAAEQLAGVKVRVWGSVAGRLGRQGAAVLRHAWCGLLLQGC